MPARKAICIFKVGNLPNGAAGCIKLHTRNIVRLVAYLQRQYPTWTWMNIFDKHTRQQIGSITKHNCHQLASHYNQLLKQNPN